MDIRFRNLASTLFLVLFSLISLVSSGQRYMEKLDHGLVAVSTNSGVFVSWRVLAWEWEGVAYNIYRDGALVNSTPIAGASNLMDSGGTSGSEYTIKTVLNGVEQEIEESASVWTTNYIDIPVREIDGGFGTYNLNDASVGDLDGDGQYEIVVKRLANGGAESSDYHYLEAYELDGTFLWAANMGPNIYNHVEFNFLVWDLDCDGKAEIILRTSDGFVDGTGNDIGDADNDGVTNYRYSISWVGYRMEGPDYLSVLDGQTGKELDRANYIPRGSLGDWGKPDDGGHRSTKCMFTVAYQDGKTPSVVMGRGIYERIVLESWDFKNGSLTRNWNFDSNNYPDYARQGYHNLTQGDVDLDGKDEVVYGSMVMDDNGLGLYSTKLGHGDALHMSDINPNREGIEFFGCLENYTGGNYRDARTGEVLHYTNIGRDMGRAGCADITPDYPGMEMWGPSGFPFLSATGDVISDLTPPSSMNFFIWWDGDLSREMLDHAWYSDNGVGTITKYNNGANNQLLYAAGTHSNNWTKGNPTLSADILGDWREEVVWPLTDNSGLRLYTTTYLTSHKIYTLMHDPQYRAAVGWQPNSYNQPPHTGFFIGTDMDSIPPSSILIPGQKVWSAGKWDLGATSAWTSENTSANFASGDRVLFDVSGDNSADVMIEGTVEPGEVRVIAPVDYVFGGEGSIGGATGLTKFGTGNLTLKNNNDYSGITRVWRGQLTNNGELSNSKVLVKRFAAAAGNGVFGKGIVIEEYGKLIVSDAMSAADTVFISGSLTTQAESNIFMDLSDDVEGTSKTNDRIELNGKLLVEGPTSITINRLDGKLSPGEYVLVSLTDSLIGSIEDITIVGLAGVPFTLEYNDKKLKLVVSDTRLPGKVYWNGGVDNQWDLFNRLNWINDGTADYFLGEDSVVFDDNGQYTTVEIQGEYAVSDFLFDADKNYTISGSGSFTGSGGLTKKGQGTLTIETLNSYTGATVIREGVLKIPEMANAGYASGIGAASAFAGNIVIDGGELEVYKRADMTSDRNIMLGENDGTIDIFNPSANLVIAGQLSGNGRLIKSGFGILSLKRRNSHKGTIINSGTLQLTEDEANISGLGDTVTFNGGALAMNDNSYSYTDGCSWHIVVPEGKTGQLKLDSRSSLTGKLFGAGKLVVYTPWIRNDLNGDWSAFTGNLDINADADGGDWRINNTYGYENATVTIRNKVYAYNLKGATKLGALAGTSGATLGSGTWSVGFNNENATYSGMITGSSTVNKYGSGSWTLTNANDYSGTTTVYEGTLIANNSTGSATGSSAVYVRWNTSLTGTGSIDGKLTIYSNAVCDMGASSKLNGAIVLQGSLIGSGNVNNLLTIYNGAVRKGNNYLNGQVVVKSGGTLSGEGLLSGNLTLEAGAVVAPGTDGIGVLTSGKSVDLISGTLLEIEINSAAAVNDVLKSGSNVVLAGTLNVAELSGAGFKAGDNYKIIEADSISGTFETVEPESPGEGLKWDLSAISEGYLGITNITSAGFQRTGEFVVYPNPGNGKFFVQLNAADRPEKIVVTNLAGQTLYAGIPEAGSGRIEVDLRGVQAGIYLIKIEWPEREVVEKLIVR